MKLDRTGVIALAALLVVVVVASGVFLYFKYVYVPPSTEDLVEEGDCVDVNYIGRYASNNTVFGSSYSDVENKTGGSPLKVFVSLDKDLFPPMNYSSYSSSPLGMIEGFVPDLIGMRKGETKTVVVPPDKAYGDYSKLSVGDVFVTNATAPPINQTVQVVNLTENSISLKWMDVENLSLFTMPQAVLIQNFSGFILSPYEYLPPYYVFKNCSQVVNVTDENVTVLTTPDKTVNLVDQVTLFPDGKSLGLIFPDVSTAFWNETTITITSTPVEGSIYNVSFMGVNLTVIVDNVTDSQMNVSIEFQGQSSPIGLINKTVSFNRTYVLPRVYKDIPMYLATSILGRSLEDSGYSLNKFAGETLIFEISVENIYKTSHES
ncbi:MAG TPA: hypothetical protein ENI42_06440 [Thermoplasmatales archaeon]|nr:hypothetical protein [Thermoplasmatales archaeon]